MAEGSAGSVFLDLVVRDTVEQQVQDMAGKAQAQAKQSFAGMENTVSAAVEKAVAKATQAATAAANSASRAAEQAAAAAQKAVQAAAASAASCGQQVENTMNKSFSKSVALAQAKVNQLERAFDDVGSKLDVLWNAGEFDPDDKTTKSLLAQQEKLFAQIEAARERLAIEVQAAAQKQAAAEEAAAAKAAAAAEAAAAKQAEAASRAHPATAPPAVPEVAPVVPATDTGAAAQIPLWERLQSLAGGFGAAASRAFAGARKVASGFMSALSSIGKRFTNLKKSAGGFGSRLKSIVSGALIFNGISLALRNITAYLGKAIGSADSMKQALANLKGAAATAAAPIVEMLTPALTALANAAATVFSYMSRLISYFTGKSVSSMAKAAKGMQSAASTAKKATASLAGFDEIERLGGDQGGDSDSGSSGFNYDFRGQSDFLDSILGAVKAGRWSQVGALVAQKLNDSLAAIPWKDIQSKMTSWARDVVAVINGFADELDFARVGQTIGEGINTVADMLGTFMRELDWAGLGTGVGEGLSTAFSTVDWVQIRQDLSAGVIGVFDFATNFIREIDWRNVGSTIVECLLSIDWFGILLSVVGFIGSCVEGMYGLIGGFFEGLANSCGEGFFGELFRFFADLAGWLNEKIVTPIVDAFTDVDASLTSIWEDGILPAIKNAVNGIIGFINGMISGVCSGINTIIRAMNKLKWDIPDWVPVLGGKTFGFSLKEMTAPQIPMLADGGVITQPTLAMMGEYAGAGSDPEIAAPQSILEETVANVMQDLINSNLQGFEAVVEVLRDILEAVLGIEIGDNVIGQAVQRYNAKMAIVRGG